MTPPATGGLGSRYQCYDKVIDHPFISRGRKRITPPLRSVITIWYTLKGKKGAFIVEVEYIR